MPLKGHMNQKLWSGLTAALILTALVPTPQSRADQLKTADENLETNVSLTENSPVGVASNSSSMTNSTETQLDAELGDVEKVGEYQSQGQSVSSQADTVATLFSHSLEGREAATLYVRNIPVLTFLRPESGANGSPSAHSSADADVKVASVQSAGSTERLASAATATGSEDSGDPVWRATAIAARVNQLYRDGANAEAITVRWNVDQERFLIEVNGSELVEVNEDTILPDTTQNLAQDALQITNRLRRQLGNAEPLREVADLPRPRPQPQQQASFGSVQSRLSGLASWYGPGFNGRRSASGEIFNQNAMTAAHRTLPFGTQVRVTNVHTGQSVVVRINDRGPFTGGRIIDLSAAAARAVGLMQAGVAPVQLDVLGSNGQPATSARN